MGSGGVWGVLGVAWGCLGAAAQKTKKFAFSRENARWLVLQKYPPESQAKEKEKWSLSALRGP